MCVGMCVDMCANMCPDKCINAYRHVYRQVYEYVYRYMFMDMFVPDCAQCQSNAASGGTPGFGAGGGHNPPFFYAQFDGHATRARTDGRTERVQIGTP